MLEALLAKLLGWIPTPWSGVRLKHKITAELCTFGHPIIGYLEDPLPRGPLHVDVTLKLWVSEHRTTAHEMTVEAAGQRLDAALFQPMTLEPGAEPSEQTVAVGPPEGQQLRTKAGDKAKITLRLTRGRPRRLKVPIEPEQS